MRRYLFAALLLLLAASGCYKPESESYPLGHEKNPLVMAFVPSTEAEKVIESGAELAALLQEDTGLYFKPQMVSSYVSVVEAMAVERVHVAWLPPMAYVYANERNGDRVILNVVRRGSPFYRGQVVVNADSGIESVEQLKGKTVAFTDPTSASGHYYPAALLKEHGIDPEVDIEVLYAGSHDAAVLALVKGSVDAACCYEDARGKLQDAGFPDIMETTRVLAYTPEIPADNVSVIKSLSAELEHKVTGGLIALTESERGQEVLFDLYEVEGLIPARDSDYDPVRQMANLLGKDIEQELKQEDG